jgi:hypothetical protein
MRSDLADKNKGPRGLYDPSFEHDSCGVGFLVNVNGARSHKIVSDGITILKNLVHRGALTNSSKSNAAARASACRKPGNTDWPCCSYRWMSTGVWTLGR